MALRVGLVAGETSGDLIAASLIKSIKNHIPEVRFEGIAGPRMQAAGCRILAPAEKLAVMGLVEPLKRLPELLRLRHRVIRHFIEAPPDVFIGIDAPDFNLGIERKLRQAGIPTVHYVSPSVWAWRGYRIRKIARSVDLMLTLFPFEADFYQQHGVPVVFTGHPLAEQIQEHTDRQVARRALDLHAEGPVLALLPGSRSGEVARLAPDFLRTAKILFARHPEMRFIAPMATLEAKRIFAALRMEMAADLPLAVYDGRSHEAMAAADAVLLASGTATLEAMLLKRPMVVAYRLAPSSYHLIKRLKLMQVEWYSLPNLLARERLVPEFIQDAVTPQALAGAIDPLLYEPQARHRQTSRFYEIHHQLQGGGSERAAKAILELTGTLR